MVGILRGHRGALEVVSEVGRGTTFRAFFAASSQRPPDEAEPPLQFPAGAALVLVIDDEVAIMRAVRAILEQAGYRTLGASNPDDGLRVFAERHAELALVLVDVTMPKKSGLEVLTEIRASSATIPVVLTTGYSIDADAVRERLADEHVDLLRKPFSANVLLDRIRRSLAHVQ
ncbi:MAG: hybrid sensor histidine kinase/response regulator [Myxococcales bacterium]|nr:hybrid sensor histidine kinase/response regulator [Myxococcales bacterium]